MQFYPSFLTHPRDIFEDNTRLLFWIVDIRREGDVWELGGIKQTSDSPEVTMKSCSMARKEDLRWFPVSKCKDFIFFDDEGRIRLIQKMQENGMTKNELLKMELPQEHQRKAVEELPDL